MCGVLPTQTAVASRKWSLPVFCRVVSFLQAYVQMDDVADTIGICLELNGKARLLDRYEERWVVVDFCRDLHVLPR